MEFIFHSSCTLPGLAHFILGLFQSSQVIKNKTSQAAIFVVSLEIIFQNVYGQHHDLVNRYQLSVTCMMTNVFCHLAHLLYFRIKCHGMCDGCG